MDHGPPHMLPSIFHRKKPMVPSAPSKKRVHWTLRQVVKADDEKTKSEVHQVWDLKGTEKYTNLREPDKVGETRLRDAGTTEVVADRKMLNDVSPKGEMMSTEDAQSLQAELSRLRIELAKVNEERRTSIERRPMDLDKLWQDEKGGLHFGIVPSRGNSVVTVR